MLSKSSLKRFLSIVMALFIMASMLVSLAACGDDEEAPQGEQGPRGEQGPQGAPGADGHTPFIGENGNWWIGEVDTGVRAAAENGQNGIDGVDGINGTNGTDGIDGVDGITPQLSYDLDAEAIYVSYDNGSTWTELLNIGEMIGEIESGAAGTDGVSITSCEINEDGELIVYYSSGESDNLGKIVGEDGIDGIDGTDAVGISSLRIDESGKLIVALSDGSAVDLGNIKGQDAITPLLRINTGTFNWEVSYDNGNSWIDLGIPAIGTKGDDGRSPIVKIENGKWYASYDNGENWTDLNCNATGADGNDGRGIKNMEIIGGYLWVTYTDDTSVNLGRVTAEVSGMVNPGVTPDYDDGVYTDGLAFYPLGDGSEYGVRIGNAIYMDNVVIPETYKGKPVTVILDNAFNPSLEEGPIGVKSVSLPSSIRKIGENAFDNCPELTSITVPAGVEEIGEFAFMGISVVIFEISEDSVPEGEDWSAGTLGYVSAEWAD